MAASIRCYDYASVYKDGREFQLEQVRASLPQYKSGCKKSTLDVVCYQKDKVYPLTGGELQLEQVRAMLPQYQMACEMEMTEVATAINEVHPSVIPMKRLGCVSPRQ